MESTVVAALAAAIGSVVGASASIATSLISQRTQALRANVEWQIRKRETLYNEFITEASRLAVDAHVHSLEGAEQLAAIYAVLSRIRLISSDDVVRRAEACCHHIVELYWRPNITLEEFRAAYEADQLDSLKEFSIACRLELMRISPSK
jgi:hypothetical protein